MFLRGSYRIYCIYIYTHIYIYICYPWLSIVFFLAPCRNLKYFEGEIAKVAFLPGKVKRFETRAPLPPPWGPTIDSWKTYLELS